MLFSKRTKMHLMNIIALFTNASIREMYMKFFSGCAHFCSCCYCSVVFGWRARIFNVYFYACGALFELVVLCCVAHLCHLFFGVWLSLLQVFSYSSLLIVTMFVFIKAAFVIWSRYTRICDRLKRFSSFAHSLINNY